MTAVKLAWVGWLRGFAALALGAYVLSRPAPSPALLASGVAVYWVVDGMVTLWGGLIAATLPLGRAVVVLRALAGLGAAFVLLALPLAEIFGGWQPGQFLMLLGTVGLALAAVALQVILAVTVDVLAALRVRQRIPGEWSLLLGAALSALLSLLLAITFVTQSGGIGRALGLIAAAAGLGLMAGAVRLRLPGTRPSPAVPH